MVAAAVAAVAAGASEMSLVHPEFVPDPALSRAEMEALQRDIADAARFTDDLDFEPTAVSLDDAQSRLGADPASDADPPVVVGVDQAFVDDRAVSALVAMRGGTVVERTYAVSPVELPYIPGLLSFREGGAILKAFETLSVEPDLLVVDGSGRIHFRQAGLATHVGVTLGLPAVGVAKGLLCGRPRASLEDPLPQGARVPIEANGRVDAPNGTVIGYAFQSRQYDSGNRYVNPLYVSPGHRVSAETATDLVERLCGGYKLPEPTRLADRYADEAKRDLKRHD